VLPLGCRWNCLADTQPKLISIRSANCRPQRISVSEADDWKPDGSAFQEADDRKPDGSAFSYANNIGAI